MAAKDGWTPIKRGGIYCSPRCGAKCTYVAYTKANSSARVLAKHLGPGWMARVWENMGWHYEAIYAGVVAVRPATGGTYLASTVGVNPQFCTYGATPEEAVAEVVADLQAHYSQITLQLQGVLKAANAKASKRG